MKRFFTLFILVFFTFTTQIHAQENWKLVKEEEGIQIYLNENQDEELVHIKAVSTANSSLEKCYQLMTDIHGYKDWMHGAEKINLLNKIEENKFNYYMLTDFPWPAKDRDIVIQIGVYRDQDMVYTRAKNLQGQIPPKEDYERIEKMNASWKFKEIHPNKIQITYEGKINSGIPLPEWLAKHIYHIAPFNTIKNMKERI